MLFQEAWYGVSTVEPHAARTRCVGGVGRDLDH
jgi:hypothetical protein